MPSPRMTLAAAALLALLVPASSARAQGAIAYAPVIGNVPDGVMLNVTPVVSADRRYVRMSLTPNFITVDHFDTFVVPGAVAGFGGFGGFGGGNNGNGFGGGGGGRGGGGGGGMAAGAEGGELSPELMALARQRAAMTQPPSYQQGPSAAVRKSQPARSTRSKSTTTKSTAAKRGGTTGARSK